MKEKMMVGLILIRLSIVEMGTCVNFRSISTYFTFFQLLRNDINRLTKQNITETIRAIQKSENIAQKIKILWLVGFFLGWFLIAATCLAENRVVRIGYC